MSVQAMFYVKEIRHLHNGSAPDASIAEIRLSAAFGSYLKGLPEEGNRDWSKYTPQGDVTMTVTNPAAIDQFELGGVYCLTFEKVA